jgi:dTDP-4-dehydrorhamnose 3,5-epimerase
LKPRRFADARGYFVETYNEQRFRQSGIVVHFVQDNQSSSICKGTISGAAQAAIFVGGSVAESSLNGHSHDQASNLGTWDLGWPDDD